MKVLSIDKRTPSHGLGGLGVYGERSHGGPEEHLLDFVNLPVTRICICFQEVHLLFESCNFKMETPLDLMRKVNKDLIRQRRHHGRWPDLTLVFDSRRSVYIAHCGAQADCEIFLEYNTILGSFLFVQKAHARVWLSQLLCGHLHAGKQAILANFKDAPQRVNIDHSSPQSQLVAGLGYDYLDVKDPQDQGVPASVSSIHAWKQTLNTVCLPETLARCSVYRLSKPSLPFLDIPLQPSNLSDTVALICLDGSKPETFLSDLVAWLSLLHQAAAQWTSKEPKQQQQQQQDPSSSEIKRQARPEYHLQMAQDRLSHIWTSYEEPAVKQGEHAGPSVPSSHGAGAPAELPQGALEANFGLQLVVVCTKVRNLDICIFCGC